MIVVVDAGAPTSVLYSATDLTAAAVCEFALVRRLDAKLGRIAPLPEVTDDMLERAARLGDAHELRTLEAYRLRYGPFDPERGRGVAEIERPERTAPAELARAEELTVAALRAGADVVFQATFFDGRFLGFADFIVRASDDSADGVPVYEVYDTKLARHAKITALLQVAAYSEQLARLGVPLGEEVHLLLGDGTRSTHLLRDILPVYLDRRRRLEELLDARIGAATGEGASAEAGAGAGANAGVSPNPGVSARAGVTGGAIASADVEPVRWGDDRFTACGRCDVCAPEVAAHRDLLLVAGMRLTQRSRLRAVGITTLDELAESSGEVPGVGSATLEALRDQARLQRDGRRALTYRVFDPAALDALPAPDPGDIFFDFEGDPLYSEPGPDGTRADWGLDYLFGLVEHDPSTPGQTVFLPFWAHSYAEEAVALERFLDHATTRLREHPDMHIYHYADYERAHLQSLCARHGVGEEQLDELLRAGVLVDLYPVVKKSVRVSSPSYSLKKLEPLYMGDRYRASGVTNAADSITAYAEYVALRDAGETDPVAAQAAERQLQEIADYNEYDCVSTLELRDWLLGRAVEFHQRESERESGSGGASSASALSGNGTPGEGLGGDTGAGVAGDATGLPGLEGGSAVPPTDERDLEPSALHRSLAAWAVHPRLVERPADRMAVALAAAAIDYHRREDKSFWWEHYARLEQPLEEWADTRDVLTVEASVVDRDWYRDAGQRALRRRIRVRGVLAPGSRLEEGARGRFFVYDPPHPWPAPRSRPTDRVAHDRTVLREVVQLTNGITQYEFEESLPMAGEPYTAVPIAVAPSAPPKTASLQVAIAEWGQQLADELPAFPADPAVDILRRAVPRRRDGRALEPVAEGSRGAIDAIRDSLLALDDSYLAVQGPPGTGKTYTGARVVADLVNRHGWTVGVVAQSHAVVENMLDAIVGAGVDPSRVGKVTSDPEAGYTALGTNGLARFLAGAAANGHGAVVGGTAWDATNLGRIGRKQLDLLVIDEAGQYSLANTIAVSVAARNLLLLGDPQQLPQVTQGTHPEPVDASALGWLTEGHDVLPHELGYFLDVSWRMHPAVCAPVSALSYEGELHSEPVATTARRLDGVEPGLVLHPVAHQGNATESPEEAERVVAIVRDAVGRLWTDPADENGPRPLEAQDVIVVAAYNAQVERLRAHLSAAGFEGVAVGTVDTFQGREAPVAIVSLAASSAVEVPRGIAFLLMKNRLNVAISRAKWVAHLVYSPALTDHLPANTAELATLSAFLRLTAGAPTAPSPGG